MDSWNVDTYDLAGILLFWPKHDTSQNNTTSAGLTFCCSGWLLRSMKLILIEPVMITSEYARD